MPTAGRGEVRVRVLASSIEYTELGIRRHVYAQTMFRRPPFVLGYDVVGQIDQLGEGVSGFQIGERRRSDRRLARMPPIVRCRPAISFAYPRTSMRQKRRR